MRKLIALAFVLALCLTLACPALAAQDDFVPSITYKGEPEIVPEKDPEGKPAVGHTYEAEAEDDVISYVYEDCLVITPVSKVDSSEQIPNAAAEELKYVYNALVSGEMKLPYDKVSGIDGSEMVILELLDISWLCGTPASSHDHPTEVEPEGVVFDITFDLNVAEFAHVTVMTYNNGEWNPVEEVVNNGDGTVTCTFEHLCPVAFSVSEGYTDTPPQTGDTSGVWMWFVVMLVALAGIAAVAVFGLRKKSRK